NIINQVEEKIKITKFEYNILFTIDEIIKHNCTIAELEDLVNTAKRKKIESPILEKARKVCALQEKLARAFDAASTSFRRVEIEQLKEIINEIKNEDDVIHDLLKSKV